jgi:Kdo2-lipid IVA lauroyltransferase/acyltransferase
MDRLYFGIRKGEWMAGKKKFSLAKFLKIHLGYLLFKFSTFWVKCLPVESLASYGERLGLLGFHLLRRWRRVAFANLNLALGQEKGKDEIHWICRELFKNIGRDILEVYRCPDFKDGYFKALVKFEGKEHLDNALTQGKGAIAVSAHLGNFPLMGARLAREGYPSSVVTRDPENPKIAKAITSLRDAVRLETIPDEPRMACVSRCLKALKENRILLLQVDQNAPVTEAWVDFFGYLVPTFKGPVLFSMRTGAPILPMFMRRHSNNFHQITIQPPFTLNHTGNVEQDITSNLARLTKIIEAAIREYPEQWLWIYRRFKRARDTKTGERLFHKHP